MSRRNRQQETSQERRDFLFKSACAALTMAGITNTIRDLRMINAAAAASAPKGHSGKLQGLASPAGATPATAPPYRALVCIFMFGGNDGNNLLIPTDTTTYNQYVRRPPAFSDQRRSIACRWPIPRRSTRPRQRRPHLRPAPRLPGPGQPVQHRKARRPGQRRHAPRADHPRAVPQPQRRRRRRSSSPTTTSRSSGRRRSKTSRPKPAGAAARPTCSTRSTPATTSR